MQDVPFTERSNPLSANLDGGLASAEFLAVMQGCEDQIFSGYEGQKGLSHPDVLSQMERVARECGRVVGPESGPPGLVVFTGCGTSGRIAYLVSNRYANAFKRPLFTYACAGGDSALLLSDELPEDDPALGRDDLEDVLKRGLTGKRAYVVGVTCGLSAPYVAGQLLAAMKSSSDNQEHIGNNPFHARSLEGVGVGAACVGFNPVQYSREIPLKNIHAIDEQSTCRTFRDVMEVLEVKREATESWGDPVQPLHALINPVIGPEAVTGSSRMKGGSATMVILDILCLRTLHYSGQLEAAGGPHSLDKARAITAHVASHGTSTLLKLYHQVHELTYSQCRDTLPLLMEKAAATLRAEPNTPGGRVYYLGCGSGAALGCIDASEMPDTYGAPFDQTRGFVAGGWGASGLNVQNSHGNLESHYDDGDDSDVDEALSAVSAYHRIGLQDFMKDILPSLTGKDTVIVLLSVPEVMEQPLTACNNRGHTDPSGAFSPQLEELVHVVELVAAQGLSSCLSCAIASSQPAAILKESRPLFRRMFNNIPPENRLYVHLPGSVYGIDSAPLSDQCEWGGVHVGFADFSLKLITNAVTTYAQAKGRGAVFRSLMVTAGPANDKIFMRCVRIIASTIGVTTSQAEVALLASIHGVDVASLESATVGHSASPALMEQVKLRSVEETKPLMSMTREEHIAASILPAGLRGQASYVLPVAILLAANYNHPVTEHGNSRLLWSIEAARDAIAKEPNISLLLQRHMKNGVTDEEEEDVLYNVPATQQPSSSLSLPLPPTEPSGNEGCTSTTTTTTTRSSISKRGSSSSSSVSVAGGGPSSCPEFLIGIDMGGTNIRAGVIDPSTGHELIPAVKVRVKEAATETTSPHRLRELLISLYVQVVRQLASVVGLSATDGEPVPITIGIGTPGQVDNTRGTITGLANYPEWGNERVPIRKYLGDAIAAAATAHRCGRERKDFFAKRETGESIDGRSTTSASTVKQAPIFIFDDANCALFAEVYYGRKSTREARRVVMLTLGTGVGVGYYYRNVTPNNNPTRGVGDNGVPYIEDRGAVLQGNRALIEGGHAIVHHCRYQSEAVPALMCACGQVGCIEVYCSGTGLGRAAQRAECGSTGEELISAVKNSSHSQHSSALKQLEVTTTILASAIHNLTLAYGDDATVLLGGGVGSIMLPYLIESARDDGRKLPLKRPGILECASVAEPGIVGAAACALAMTKEVNDAGVDGGNATNVERDTGEDSAVLLIKDEMTGGIACRVTLDGKSEFLPGRECCKALIDMSTVIGSGSDGSTDLECATASSLFAKAAASNHGDTADEILAVTIVNILRYYDPRHVLIDTRLVPRGGHSLDRAIGAVSWHLYNDVGDVHYEIANLAAHSADDHVCGTQARRLLKRLRNF